MKKVIILISIMLLSKVVKAQKNLRVPSFEEVLSLPVPSNPQISPNGKHIVYQVRTADWKDNKYDTELWLSKNGNKPMLLTNNTMSGSYSPKWSPDGQWIAFLSYRGNGNQIYVISFDGGESFQATNIAGGINSFEWSPNSQEFAVSISQKESDRKQKIKQRFGDYYEDDEQPSHNWLYTIDFKPESINSVQLPCYSENKDNCVTWAEPTPIIANVDFSIGAFKWSPDGFKIAFDKQPNELVNSYLNSDIGIIDVKTKKWYVLVQNSSFDFVSDWSPNSKSIVYISALDNSDGTYYKNNHFFTINVNTKKTQKLAIDFDEELKDLIWTHKGIYARAYQKTKIQLFLINPDSGSIKLVNDTLDIIYGFSISSDAAMIVLLARTNDSLEEVYTSSIANFYPKKITTFNDKISNWKVAQSQIVTWKSKDGTIIEGVLHKPKDYDPQKKYPLLISIHGGPTSVDRPAPVPVFYPVLQWLDKGALVFRPNYRGSGGYGEKFRSSNVRNFGLGAVDDILSGVDYLESLGIIDTNKMGCMGWSHGGYISALLATKSNRFKGFSVGAGISDWVTDYVTTDLHPFALQYLKETPWDNPNIYAKSSPITYIKNATTPTLIQHGENDKRVPIANAYELLQGLRDVNVETKLIIYKGLGHVIYKPKERLAAVWHNWQWFGKYVFGEDIKMPLD